MMVKMLGTAANGLAICMVLMAGLAAISAGAHAGPAYRYSWYYYQGPYFSTPAEVCAWSQSIYPVDGGEATMALGVDGFCRADNGKGYLYIKPYVSVVPHRARPTGRSNTNTLPAGQVLPVKAQVIPRRVPPAPPTAGLRK